MKTAVRIGHQSIFRTGFFCCSQFFCVLYSLFQCIDRKPVCFNRNLSGAVLLKIRCFCYLFYNSLVINMKDLQRGLFACLLRKCRTALNRKSYADRLPFSRLDFLPACIAESNIKSHCLREIICYCIQQSLRIFF